MKIPPQSEARNREMLKQNESIYRGLIKNQVHHCKDIVATRSLKQQIEDTVHTMQILRKRLGIISRGDQWLHDLVYGHD